MLDIVYVYFVGGGELRTFSVLEFSMFFLLRGGGAEGRDCLFCCWGVGSRGLLLTIA